MAIRQSQESFSKLYQVKDAGGFIIGNVSGYTVAEARIKAVEQYGPDCSIGDTIEMTDFTAQLVDELGDRTLFRGVCYQSAFVPVIKTTPVVMRDAKAPVGMEEDINGTVDGLLNDWFLHHPGIRIIHFSNTKDPISGFVGFLIVYYQMIDLPIVHTLDELSPDARLTPKQQQDQNAFLIELTTSLRTNEALFDYANLLGVEWARAKHPITERSNCVKAIRKFHNWI